MRHERRSFTLRALALLASAPGGPALAKALGYPRLLEGPMVGAVGPDHLSIWSRASGAFEVQVEYATDRAFTDAKLTPPVRAAAEQDLCTVVRVEGLQPGTRYFYRMHVNGIRDRHAPVAFHTKTAPAGPANFRVAFGSCVRQQLDPEQLIFSAIAQQGPDLFFWLGDNIYCDSDDAGVMAGLYQRQRAVPRLQPLIRSTPQLAIWDDHDFGYNNGDRHSPFKDQALSVFRRYWANPAYGQAGMPGCFFKYQYGGVDFFFLDGRYHRDSPAAPDRPGKTMLGSAQKRWLKAELKASRAPFKVLVSGTGWSTADMPGDSWSAFLDERNELFDFIRDEKIGGVFGISGDQHLGELNCIPWSERGGYDFYDLTSSGLAQNMNDDWPDQAPEVRMREVYSKGYNFGMLEFRMDGAPSVSLNVHDLLGGPAWRPLVLTPDDLRNGRRTWERLIDPQEHRRLLRYRSGGAYYGPERR
jgi:alkaline phosphatase D